MDIKKLAAEGSMEEIERKLMELDSEFSFKCRKCGKCCKHQNAYTGPAAPSARNFSPTQPEGSPTPRK